jgi:hypothetical protein
MHHAAQNNILGVHLVRHVTGQVDISPQEVADSTVW